MARMIDGNKLVENLRLIATCWSISPFVSKEKHNGAVNMLREVEREVKKAPTLTPPNEPLTLEFDVVDTKTGQYPDWEHIARTENWADGLVYCDIDGIAIREDGSLILLDECGNCVSCPRDRFEIRRPTEMED